MPWPQGVSDQTPLPFSMWRELEALSNGTPNLSGPALQQLITLAEQYAVRAQRREQVVSAELIGEVSAALIASIGPMGQVMVEDALDELPAPVLLAALLRALGQELAERERQAFGQQLRERGLL